MSDETRRILDLLAQGKLTVDEAAELLKALGAARTRPDSPASEARTGARARYIRIAVRKRRGRGDAEGQVYAWPGCMGASGGGPKEVNIRVPLSLVRSGMRLGAIVPGGADFLAQVLRDRGFAIDNLSKIDADQLEAILKEMGEITVDVDQGRAEVRISAE
jgi:SHOCT-like protein